MDEENYKSNSFKSKEVPDTVPNAKKLQRVTTGEITTRKKSFLRKAADIIINQNVDNIKDYVIFDVIIPSIRNTVNDTLISIVEMLFGSRRKSNGTPTTSYSAYYKNGQSTTKPANQDNRGSLGLSKRDFDEVIVENRWEAEDIIDQMVSCIAEYGSVSIADFYELVGIQSNFTDNKYGWTNLSSAMVERVGGGYLIKLPPTVKLD